MSFDAIFQYMELFDLPSFTEETLKSLIDIFSHSDDAQKSILLHFDYRGFFDKFTTIFDYTNDFLSEIIVNERIADELLKSHILQNFDFENFIKLHPPLQELIITRYFKLQTKAVSKAKQKVLNFVPSYDMIPPLVLFFIDNMSKIPRSNVIHLFHVELQIFLEHPECIINETIIQTYHLNPNSCSAVYSIDLINVVAQANELLVRRFFSIIIHTDLKCFGHSHILDILISKFPDHQQTIHCFMLTMNPVWNSHYLDSILLNFDPELINQEDIENFIKKITISNYKNMDMPCFPKVCECLMKSVPYVKEEFQDLACQMLDYVFVYHPEIKEHLDSETISRLGESNDSKAGFLFEKHFSSKN